MQGIGNMSNQILSIPDIPYEYDKLLRDNSFRYLVLQPGVGNEPLECSLCTAPLPQIEFEAISYVWGKDIKNQRIICDGRRISITTNLHNVLQRLRLSDQPRKLWADGICINQDDIDEKGHQVAIMGQLYRSAKRVLIYVGPDEGGYGPQLCSLLDEVDQMIEETCKRIDMSWGSFPYPDENNPLLSDVRWKSIYHLFWEEWFERGWVVREAACAQIGQVIWGSSNFDWRKLTRAYWWLLRRASQTFSDAKLFSTRGFILHAEAYARHNKALTNSLAVELPAKKTALLEDLRNAILLKVSDPRDRIYAFMELSSDDEYAFIMTPDYNLPYLDVYRNFAIDYTRFTAAPSILDYVVHPGGALNPSEASWIPLWNLARAEWGNGVLSVSHTMLTSRDDSICEPSFGGKTTLKCRGVVLDRVTYAKHILRDESTAQQIFSKIWNDIQVHTRRSPYGPTRLLDAFLNTLSLGHYEEDWESWMRSRAAFVANFTLKQRHSHSAALLPEDIEGADDVINIFIQTVSRRISDSEFIATEREYMGIAPGFAQVGDLCAIIFGCTTPCILRPTDSQGRYKFFGACHITGKQSHIGTDGSVRFEHYLGSKQSKDWVDWDVEEQDIYLV